MTLHFLAHQDGPLMPHFPKQKNVNTLVYFSGNLITLIFPLPTTYQSQLHIFLLKL